MSMFFRARGEMRVRFTPKLEMPTIRQTAAFFFVTLVANGAHAQIRLGRPHTDYTALIMVAGLFVLGVGALWLAVGRRK